MIKGIGNDIIEVERIKKTIEKHGDHFFNKFFSKNELEYCLAYKDVAPHISGKFSAKEAIVKALGTGFGKIVSFLDIEILNNDLGRPYVTFSDRLNEYFNHPNILISISHCKAYATSVALWLED